jgi:hypothetical protein
LRIGGLEIGLGAADEFGEIRDVATVGVERVLAGALFGRKHVEEQAGEPGVRGCWGAHAASLALIS